jgi:hypothetical protein
MPRYVVLEHTWNGLHWDVMLECGDHLRTWAVDAPIEPGVDFPARALGDHRLMYLDYEGPVSRDRGEVRAWDQGVYEPIEWASDRVRVRLQGLQLVGVLELRVAEGVPFGWVLRFGKAD